ATPPAARPPAPTAKSWPVPRTFPPSPVLPSVRRLPVPARDGGGPWPGCRIPACRTSGGSVLAEIEEQPAAVSLARAFPDPVERAVHEQFRGRPGHRPEHLVKRGAV